MAVIGGPNVVNNGLVLYLDAANYESYPGRLGAELVTNSILLREDGVTFNVLRTASEIISLALCNVEANKSYIIEYVVSSYTGGTGASLRINTSASNVSPVIGISSAGKFARVFTAVASGQLAIQGDNTGTDFRVDYVSVRELLDSPNQWTDISNNNNNFTAYNTPTYNSSGYWSFGGVNQYFSDTSFPLAWGNSDSTIEAVFRVSTSVTGVFGLLSTMSAPFNVDSLGMEIRLRSFGMEFTINDGVAGGIRTQHGLTWQTNLWYHYAFSYIKSTSCTMYANGSNVSTVSYAGELNYSTIYDLNLGRASDGYFNGDIASVKIYNRALSAAEIQQNYNATKSRFGL